MIRTLLWLAGGALLGGVIHISVILTLPALAEQSVWTRLADLPADNAMIILPPAGVGAADALGLDPALVYGLCRIDLAEGPAYVSGRLPDAFWSVALFDPAGLVTYSTTNRDGIGQTLELGIFNSGQTRLLARQQLDIAEGTLVVESTQDRLLALIRLAPPHQAVRARFEQELHKISCGPKG